MTEAGEILKTPQEILTEYRRRRGWHLAIGITLGAGTLGVLALPADARNSYTALIVGLAIAFALAEASRMKPLLVLLIAFQLACDAGVDVSYRVSMQPAEADSITQLSVGITGALAQRYALDARGTTDPCSLETYYATTSEGWLDFCVTHATNAVQFHLSEYRTGSWSSKGDRLRADLRDTLTAQFGARVSGNR